MYVCFVGAGVAWGCCEQRNWGFWACLAADFVFVGVMDALLGMDLRFDLGWDGMSMVIDVPLKKRYLM
jgi:hypothetical protein